MVLQVVVTILVCHSLYYEQETVFLWHQLHLSVEHHMRVNRFGLRVSQLKSAYASPTENSTTLYEKPEVDLLQSWSDPDPYSLIETSIIFTAVF